jgi:hypothetical protein
MVDKEVIRLNLVLVKRGPIVEAEIDEPPEVLLVDIALIRS